ncbi:MAG: sugar phosphate isomerase/epimerase [Candidatus Sumerlaeota bacterium]|nr:sugar phosphate isomerase/epimerase [Candidatus Sumerlaeota bacterium]
MKRYGISSWIVRNLEPRAAVAALGASGFRETELSAAEGQLVQAWERDPQGICGQLKAAGLAVRSIHCPPRGYGLCSTDATARQASYEAYMEYFDAMRRGGIEEIVVHPWIGRDIAPEERPEAPKARAMESLAILAERARRFGVKLAVENLPGKAPNLPGQTVEELLELIEGLGGHVGLCLDTGHAYMRGLDLVDQLKKAGKTLFSLHMHDIGPDGKDHFIPGEGAYDWGPFLTLLDSDHANVVRTIEVKPPESNDIIAERLRKAAAVKDAWEKR